MKQEILIINQDAGYLMIDIANEFSNANWNCTLLSGRLVIRDKPLGKKIKFRKIIRYDRSNNFRRIFTWSIAFFQLLTLVLLRYRKSHLFIVSNPPFAPLLPLFCHNKFSLLIFDVYPDALTELGICPERSWVIRLWKKINRRIFAKANQLFTITNGMKHVLQQYAGKKPVKVVPVWTDNNFLKPIPKDSNPFVLQHGLLNKFIVLYSGNLGYSHNIEVIIELAASIENPEILFLIIGDGDKKKQIQKKIHNHCLKNCMMLPFQKAADLPYSLSSADLAIVSLRTGASRLSIPSKTYNLMSVGVPLLCIAEQDSELAALVGRYDIGKCLSSYQLKEMKDFVNELHANPQELERLQENALTASLAFSPENAKKFLPQ